MSDQKPRLLFHSNAPWTGTGYGQQTAAFAPKLRDHYDLTISAFWGLEGNILPWNGIPVLPGVGQTYGNETIIEHARTVFGDDLRSGLTMTLMDCWVLDAKVWRKLNVAAWAPVDHEPVPTPVLQFFTQSGAVAMAMSRFGERQLTTVDPLYVPHAVDTSLYKPYDQAESRKAVSMPEDGFIVGMVAANKGNPSRKCFAESFLAFKALHERHPEAKLYLHTEATGRFQGVDLLSLLDSVGVPAGATHFCDQYRTTHFPLNHETMARIYNSMDVLLAPSAGEGFGIPVVEAQACGVPVIVSDFSSQPELCGAGWIVDGAKTYTPIGSWQFRPDVADILEALCRAYGTKAEKEMQTNKARAFALDYDVDTVYEKHMRPALEKAQERFDARKPKKLKVAA